MAEMDQGRIDDMAMRSNRETKMDVKVGDTVHVRAQVTGTDRGLPRVEYEGAFFTVFRKDIVHVEPRALVVGDTVTWGSKVFNFRILAIDGDEAWLRSIDSTVWKVEPLRALVRA